MSAEYPVGTVARVRVGEWEGRAGRDWQRSPGGGRLLAKPLIWLLIGHPFMRVVADSDLTVLAVELPAPVAEPKAFGARVEFGPEGERDEAVLADPSDYLDPWFVCRGSLRGFRQWSELTNPVVLHDPEAEAQVNVHIEAPEGDLSDAIRRATSRQADR